MNNKIEIEKWNKDCSSSGKKHNNFVFSMKRGDVLKPTKYELKEGMNDFMLCQKDGQKLCGFGGENVGQNVKFRDVFVPKEEWRDKAYCSQFSYEYNKCKRQAGVQPDSISRYNLRKRG